MGSEISKGVDGLGSAIGSAFTAPFKSVFGGSCQFVVLVLVVQTWYMPMHRKKPL
ncbi:hypothetical protein L195_g022225 [Trifolium pratense]|uniref:Uncharacterized protein n=1 Tax=Trifolium pratense TaxID=57577 RepID=A0A2K3N7D7_TRIPR|nr:hypothetical protein L195_g022225 [Trifolium pratense]